MRHFRRPQGRSQQRCVVARVGEVTHRHAAVGGANPCHPHRRCDSNSRPPPRASRAQVVYDPAATARTDTGQSRHSHRCAPVDGRSVAEHVDAAVVSPTFDGGIGHQCAGVIGSRSQRCDAGSPGTGTGAARGVTVASPSRLNSLSPQPLTVVLGSDRAGVGPSDGQQDDAAAFVAVAPSFVSAADGDAEKVRSSKQQQQRHPQTPCRTLP